VSGYVLSLDADADLQDIYAYSDEAWGERQAALYLTGLYAVFEWIGRHPAIGRPRRELGDHIRSLPHAAHVVVYMPWRGEIAILRVLHGSMDVESVAGAVVSLPGMEDEPR
jgi:toxin ParE1/3/4